MPLGVVMLAYVEEYFDENFLSCLRAELLEKHGFDQDDFHSEGPLVYLPREDYDLVHLAGEPGYLLDVNLWRSYYGVGYERGYLPEFVEVAEWLEQKLTGCRIFYGEDSSGEGWPFDAQKRARLMSYFTKVGHEPYDRKDLSEEQKRELRALYDT